MARSPLPLVEALGCAAEIAAALRGLRKQSPASGAVSSQSAEPGRLTGVLRNLAEGRSDVAAFGAVLDEMLVRAEAAGEGLDGLREQARALARRCCQEAPAMQHVLISLRLMVFEARQRATGFRAVRRPAVVEPVPAPTTPRPRFRIGVRIRMNLHWKPLASLAAVCARPKE
jgi:hypothetical protein